MKILSSMTRLMAVVLNISTVIDLSYIVSMTEIVQTAHPIKRKRMCIARASRDFMVCVTPHI